MGPEPEAKAGAPHEHGEPAPRGSGGPDVHHLQRAIGNHGLATAFAGGAVLQRTSLVIGTTSNDSMVTGALDNIAEPNEIYAFDGKGDPAPDEQRTLRTMYGEKGADPTRLNVIAHGSPGRLAALRDLDAAFGPRPAGPQREPAPFRFGDFFTGQITSVNLGACWAMTKRDIDSESVASRIAKAIQAEAGPEQAVTLRAGHTPNTAGAFNAGQPSFKSPTPETIVEAQEIAAWMVLHLRYDLGLRDPPRPDKDAARDVRLDYETARVTFHEDVMAAADEVGQDIVALLRSSGSDERKEAGPAPASTYDTPATVMEIVPGGPLPEPLGRQPFAVASATSDNYASFPERLAAAIGVPDAAHEVAGILTARAARLAADNAAWFEHGKTPSGGSSGTFGSGFTFGAAPAAGGTPAPGFTFGSGAGSGFTFGAAPTTGATPGSGFTFSGAGFTFGAPATGATPARDEEPAGSR